MRNQSRYLNTQSAITALTVLLCLALAVAAPAGASVMLAGGHLPVCSSMSAGQCAEPIEWPDDALKQHGYRIDEAGILRWALSVDNHPGRAHPLQWLTLLRSLKSDQVFTSAELRERIRGGRVQWTAPGAERSRMIIGRDLYQAMDNADWWELLDHLQLAVGPRGEQVRLAKSRQAASIEIFKRFVTMAAEAGQTERPLIAISTASSRDPYDVLDFYLQVFEQAGAEVIWLPLDAAVRRARAEQNCLDLARYQALELGSHDRQRVWPEHFQSQLGFCLARDTGLEIAARIDGLFLNGGDQWLTLHAFRDGAGLPTPELNMVLRRLKQGDLVIGGTSAGAAVQSAANMISNGSNQAALTQGALASPPPGLACAQAGKCPQELTSDTLSYHPPGGLGSAALAIVDTHFSERQRQIRLLQLLIDSGQRYGIGVDETTALIVTPSSQSSHESDNASGRFQLEVLGRGAAWLIDTGDAEVHERLPLNVASVRMLRLGNGHQLTFEPEQGLASKMREPPASSSDCLHLTPEDTFDQLVQLQSPRAVAVAVCHELSLEGDRRARGQLDLEASDENGPQLIHWQLQVDPEP